MKVAFKNLEKKGSYKYNSYENVCVNKCFFNIKSSLATL